MKKSQIAAAKFAAAASFLAAELSDIWEMAQANTGDAFWAYSNTGEYILAREAGLELSEASERLLPSVTKVEVIALLHLVEWGNPIEYKYYKKLVEEEILPYL